MSTSSRYVSLKDGDRCLVEVGNEVQNEVDDLFQQQGIPNTAVMRVSGYLQLTQR